MIIFPWTVRRGRLRRLSTASKHLSRSALRKKLLRALRVESLEVRRVLAADSLASVLPTEDLGHASITTPQNPLSTQEAPAPQDPSEREHRYVSVPDRQPLSVPQRRPLALPTPEPMEDIDELTGSGSSSSYSSSSSSSSSSGPPVISSMQLVNDTGVSPSDQVTSDPRVQALIDGSFWNYGSANVEFDHDGDGSGDGVAIPTTQGTPFEYDPRVSDPAIANHTGPLTLHYRALEYDYYGNLTYQGGWQSFSMTLEADNASEISITDANSQNVQSGLSTIDLGTTNLNAPVSHSFTVYNLGMGDLSLDVNQLQLPNGFVLTTAPSATVGAFSQTTLTIQATAATAGLHSGTFSLPNNDGDEDPFTFTLQIDVVGPAPEISVTDAGGSDVADGSGSVDFGTTVVGTTIDQTLTVHNTGNAALDIDSGSLQIPAGYSLVGGYSASIAAGQTTTMTFRLTATTEGTYTGDVVFTSNDSDESPYSFTLTGIVDPTPSSPAITGIHLVHNDGISASDAIASDPTVSASVVGDFGGGSVTVEFDHEGDGVANGSVDVSSSGNSFTYDPRIAEPALSNHSGWLPLRSAGSIRTPRERCWPAAHGRNLRSSSMSKLAQAACRFPISGSIGTPGIRTSIG